MTSFSKKIKRLYCDHGFSGLIEAVVFKLLANCFHIPSRKIAVFNGIAVRGASFHSKTDIFPEHEAELISAIRNHIKNGEKVLVIGGGSGASTVAVAHQIGNNGSIIAYEANKNSAARTKETINLNKVDDRVEIKHAELPILQNMKIRPRLIIVEAHPLLNSPKEDVVKLLDTLGYKIISSDSRGESLDVLSAIRKN